MRRPLFSDEYRSSSAITSASTPKGNSEQFGKASQVHVTVVTPYAFRGVDWSTLAGQTDPRLHFLPRHQELRETFAPTPSFRDQAMKTTPSGPYPAAFWASGR